MTGQLYKSSETILKERTNLQTKWNSSKRRDKPTHESKVIMKELDLSLFRGTWRKEVKCFPTEFSREEWSSIGDSIAFRVRQCWLIVICGTTEIWNLVLQNSFHLGLPSFHQNENHDDGNHSQDDNSANYSANHGTNICTRKACP